MNRPADAHVNDEAESRSPNGDPYAGLVERIAAGDTQAFEVLFRAVYERLCAFATSYVRSPQTAEEIVGDVFLNLWRDRERLRIRTSVSSYLFVSVRNKALTYVRRTQLERRHVEWLKHQEVAAVNAAGELETEVVTRELIVMVEAAVNELPPRIRQAYLLYYQQQLSYAEIARIMEVSVRTVENQLARALKLLWSRLQGRLT